MSDTNTQADTNNLYVTLAEALASPDTHTPMIRHFLAVKKEYPQQLLFYRMGDFYELFFDDAIEAAELLGITLTRRGKNANGKEIAMAGVPYHAAEGYLARLVNLGKTVAICEQIGEVTNKPNVPMKREVVRILTPGTLTDDALIENNQSPCLVAISADMQKDIQPHSRFGIASLQISSGKLSIHEVTGEEALAHSLARISPTEIILHEDFEVSANEIWLQINQKNTPTSMRPSVDFSINNATETLCQQLEVERLDGFHAEINNLPLAKASAAALIHYAKATQKRSLPHIKSIRVQSDQQFLVLDATTRKNLELLEPQFAHGTSLLALVNHCKSSLGKRELAYQLAHPLTCSEEAKARLNTITTLNSAENSNAFVSDMRNTLTQIADIERIIGRIALKSAKPRDLKRLGDSCMLVPNLITPLSHILGTHADTHLNAISANLTPENNTLNNVSNLLKTAITDNPPMIIRDGGVIATGYDNELDNLRSIRDGIQENLQRLEANEKARNNLTSLKIGYNKVSGFFFELNRSQSQEAPAHFIRRQTLKNSERFITDELKQYEDKVLSSETRALEREKQLYTKLIEQLSLNIPELQALSDAIAQLDVFCNWSYIATTFGWTKPELHSGIGIKINAGRHPVIEQTQTTNFTPNDTLLDAKNRLMLITGPNMGGKSTFMRQTAIICILAYCGSFVPATSACIGEVDRIFTRIGSADDVSTGRSTFMVEMLETAQILHQASPRSLVLMDEVGRGTSTYDGLSLAWAIVQELAYKINCLTLFATHYFELTELANTEVSNKEKPIHNFHVVATEVKGELLLLHKLKEGATSKSYGLHVASLAGIPNHVVVKAQEKLSLSSQLTNTSSTAHSKTKNTRKQTKNKSQIQEKNIERSKKNNQLVLFEEDIQDKLLRLEAKEKTWQNFSKKLNQIDLDNCTPKQALDRLYELKVLLT